ncbi:GntR family transcriptional regulator [Thermosporothrix hazakensis]|jgi:GntR family transcriptional regulator|uniref:GntR family transcriptional regulator n=1 Tax=Thermosporothrix hazakensis TaxID=644383 RepID=A0A326USN9_THEHA|nr:GntR family transcriptional regulator [Thermosporothrix hazakensis]PZW34427.1 GntR family transcriptional regulator [Thermosporothrix hazakensis]GCE46024.1 HTH-type transcriptional repressor YvoA [Thermosporothrix hazakensis]
MEDEVRQPTDGPLYTRLRDHLAAEITSGRLAAGTRLASERALSERYGYSRLTVRRALADLEEAGLLVRRRGSGTFVAERLIRKNVRGLASFSEDMRQRGLTPGSIVLRQELVFLEEEQAQMLKVAAHEGAVCLRRLRLANDVPMALETVFLPAALCPGLVRRTDLDRVSLYEVLEREYNLSADYAEEVVEAVNASEEVARLLRVAPGSALLRIRRLTSAKDRGPFEYVESLYCGDKYSLGLNVRRLGQ